MKPVCLFIFLSLNACSTQGSFVTTNEDAWINVKVYGSEFLMRCKSKPEPVCTMPSLKGDIGQ